MIKYLSAIYIMCVFQYLGRTNLTLVRLKHNRGTIKHNLIHHDHVNEGEHKCLKIK